MRRSTWVYIIILLAVTGLYDYLQREKQAETEENLILTEAPAESDYLFNAEDGVPTGIRIESKSGEIVEVAKNAEGAWGLIQPLEASADPSAAEAAASQIAALRIEDTIPALDLEIVGLKDPAYTLTVAFGDVKRKAEIGVLTPTENKYYALSPTGEVVTIDKFSIDGLLKLLTNPPYLETPTPSPTATETSLPSSTPEPASPTSTVTTPTP
ncbi:MAG: DUF4340 domain-containing protein [Anaerolineales bacterium]|nr:DUF4340 domain-containing protein [Anaerolineales bacterium]